MTLLIWAIIIIIFMVLGVVGAEELKLTYGDMITLLVVFKLIDIEDKINK